MGSQAMSEECPERRFRTLFISDVHLGARGSQADRLLDFLRSHDADTIYLVGDIVDGWALKSNWYWPQSHNDFVQKMLRKARKGAKVVYVPGNHDEFLRNYYGTHFGGIDVVENTIHTAVVRKRWPGTKTAGSKSSPGPIRSAGSRRCPASQRAPPDEDPGRNRCVASSGGPDADHDGGSRQGLWRRGQLPHPAIVPHLCAAEL